MGQRLGVIKGVVIGLLVAALTGCSSAGDPGSSMVVAPDGASSAAPTTVAPISTSPPTTVSTTSTSVAVSTMTEPVRTGSAPPAWLGTRELPLRPGETNGIAQPTPVEFVDRQLWTEDVLTPPDVVEIFRELHAIGFPIEEMRVTTQEAVDAHPTGDSNNTSSFVCRPAVNSGNWSRHAHGGAIDINPFHNPYVLGDLVLPELASAYLDRDRDVPGMITPEVEELFATIGWGWGGDWNSASDWMHFSDTGG